MKHRVGKGTRERLLDAAEEMFAGRGFAATSVRAVTAKARANLEAVHYHFGSKRDLIRTVLSRRIGPLNAERLRLLDALDRPDLEGILRAFLAPTLAVWQECPAFMKLAGRVQTEPDPAILRFFLGQFGGVVVRFRAALRKALPRVPVEEIFWRMHFVVGAMCHTWTAAAGLERLSGGLCRIGDGKGTLERLLSFCVAGLGRKP